MKKYLPFLPFLVLIGCIVIAFVIGGSRSHVSSDSPQQNTDFDKKIDIPRTHWGITLGDTRLKVQQRLAGVNFNRKTEEAEDLIFVSWQSLNNEPEDEKLNHDMVWDHIYIDGDHDLMSISIYWYSDKVAAIKVAPYDDEIVSESVNDKYQMEDKGSYSYGTLTNFEFYGYNNDNTIIISEKITENYKFDTYTFKLYKDPNPKPSYKFIYIDRELMKARSAEREVEKQKYMNVHQEKVEDRKSMY